MVHRSCHKHGGLCSTRPQTPRRKETLLLSDNSSKSHPPFLSVGIKMGKPIQGDLSSGGAATFGGSRCHSAAAKILRCKKNKKKAASVHKSTKKKINGEKHD